MYSHVDTFFYISGGLFMAKVIHIAIVEDDPFARNWMTLLAARDWRTRVVIEVDRPLNLAAALRKTTSNIDLVLLDTDIPGETDWLYKICEIYKKLKRKPMVLCTGVKPNQHVLEQLHEPFFIGYLIKEQISYSLAWAISFAMKGIFVITDGIQALASSIGYQLPQPCYVLDGRNTTQHLTRRQAEAARLAFLFSMERRELADELGIVEDWGFGLVSAVYEKLGVRDILVDDQVLDQYFGNQELIMEYVNEIKLDSKKSFKARDMETLAFHMITMPEILELV
jgi:DNA-binding NarL/FixJ family response regulator